MWWTPIRQDNPTAARKVAKAIYEACGGLESFPNQGCKGRIRGTRELIIASLPYIVVYRVKEQTVEIARIYHGAQNWP